MNEAEWEAFLAPGVETLRKDILNLVARGKTTFVELQRLPGASGPYALGIGQNVDLWHGLSKAVLSILEDLRTSGLIHYEPTGHLTYLIDGAVLNLPLVKSAKAYAKGYRTLHWLPVTVEPGPAKT